MPTTLTPAQVARNRHAALKRFRSADDPDLIEARTRLSEEAFVGAVERALAAAPPVRPEVRGRIDELLDNHQAEVAA